MFTTKKEASIKSDKTSKTTGAPLKEWRNDRPGMPVRKENPLWEMAKNLLKNEGVMPDLEKFRRMFLCKR